MENSFVCFGAEFLGHFELQKNNLSGWAIASLKYSAYSFMK
jgi:hypothetical protein